MKSIRLPSPPVSHAKSPSHMRRLVTLQVGSSYECGRCDWKFAELLDPPKVASLLEIMRFYERQAERQFAAHRCT